MGQTTNQIETYIEHKREDLGSNLQELEHKISSITDWKHHFENSPMTMMGVAVGGGILLATMMGGRKRRRAFSDTAQSTPRSSVPATVQLKNTALETWDHIKGALIGVAATRAKDFIEEIVPGFREQFEHTQKAR